MKKLILAFKEPKTQLPDLTEEELQDLLEKTEVHISSILSDEEYIDDVRCTKSGFIVPIFNKSESGKHKQIRYFNFKYDPKDPGGLSVQEQLKEQLSIFLDDY